MQVILFALGGRTFALEAASTKRVLPPGEDLPPGCALLDLAALVGTRPDPVARDEGPGHRAVLAGGGLAVVLGRPVGSVRIEQAWIVPIPVHIFKTRGAPFLGMIEVPESARRPPRDAADRALLLDAEGLRRMAEEGGAPA